MCSFSSYQSTECMNSRRKAKDWIYPRHKVFESELRVSYSEWFKKNGFVVHNRMSYC